MKICKHGLPNPEHECSMCQSAEMLKADEKLPYYCVFIDGENHGYCSLAAVMEIVEMSIVGSPEDETEILVKKKMMTPQEYDELPEVEL